MWPPSKTAAAYPGNTDYIHLVPFPDLHTQLLSLAVLTHTFRTASDNAGSGGLGTRLATCTYTVDKQRILWECGTNWNCLQQTGLKSLGSC